MFVDLKRIRLFYSKSGSGRPILLIHGNGESHTIFDVLNEQLSDRFTVYALDSRNHGQSSRTSVINYEAMMEDVAAFITQLQIEKPILYGFSDGGIIGLLLASKYPDMLSKLIISGANTNPRGIKDVWIRTFKFSYFFTHNKNTKLMLCEPNITAEDLRKIHIPVLVLAGEKDMIKESDTKFIADTIAGAQLKIIPKENHMSYVVHSPKLYGFIKSFI